MVPVDVLSHVDGASHVDGVSHCSCVMALVYTTCGFTQLLMDAGQGFEAKNVACMHDEWQTCL